MLKEAENLRQDMEILDLIIENTVELRKRFEKAYSRILDYEQKVESLKEDLKQAKARR